MKQNIPFYLASGSPRRKELLTQMGLSYQIKTAEVSEETQQKDPALRVMELARRKARAAAKRIEEPCAVIGADTLVYYNGEFLGKPVDEADAKRMLSALSGNEHQVYTGVCIRYQKESKEILEETFAKVTAVKVMELSEEEILSYIRSKEPMDKAGAYAIQGEFSRYIEGFSGDYNTVVGLPVNELYKKLKQMNLIFI